MKRVQFRYTKGNKAGFETEYKEDVADILEKRGDGVILDRPKAVIVEEKPFEAPKKAEKAEKKSSSKAEKKSSSKAEG